MTAIRHFLFWAMANVVFVGIGLTISQVHAQSSANAKLDADDRAQLDKCVDNLIAGKAVIEVAVRGHKFLCDYARTRGYGNARKEAYGFFENLSFFDARISHVSEAKQNVIRRIEIKFAANGNVSSAGLFSEFPLAKRETRLAVTFPKELLAVDAWYADRAIKNRCAFRLGRWQETANLIAATLAIRLSQSFKYAMNARKDTEPLRYFIGLNGENLVRKGSTSPILWGVRLKGKTFKSPIKTPLKTTRQQCENSCGNSSRCVGWSFRPAEIASSGSPISARCALFDTVDSLAPGNKYVSALKPGAFVEPIDKIERPSNICGHLRKGSDGKILRVHTFCRPPSRSFFTKITSTDSCDPKWNTCRKYEPQHKVDIVGGDC